MTSRAISLLADLRAARAVLCDRDERIADGDYRLSPDYCAMVGRDPADAQRVLEAVVAEIFDGGEVEHDRSPYAVSTSQMIEFDDEPPDPWHAKPVPFERLSGAPVNDLGSWRMRITRGAIEHIERRDWRAWGELRMSRRRPGDVVNIGPFSIGWAAPPESAEGLMREGLMRDRLGLEPLRGDEVELPDGVAAFPGDIIRLGDIPHRVTEIVFSGDRELQRFVVRVVPAEPVASDQATDNAIEAQVAWIDYLRAVALQVDTRGVPISSYGLASGRALDQTGRAEYDARAANLAEVIDRGSTGPASPSRSIPEQLAPIEVPRRLGGLDAIAGIDPLPFHDLV